MQIRRRVAEQLSRWDSNGRDSNKCHSLPWIRGSALETERSGHVGAPVSHAIDHFLLFSPLVHRSFLLISKCKIPSWTNHVHFHPLCLLSFYISLFFISSYLLGQHLPTQRHHHAAAVRSSFIFPFIHLHPSIPHRHLRGSCYFTKSRPNRKVAHVYIAAFVLIEDGIEEPFSFKSPVLSPHLSVRSFLSSRQSSGGTVVLTVSADPSLIISVDSPSSRLLSPLFFGRHAHLTAATLSTPYS